MLDMFCKKPNSLWIVIIWKKLSQVMYFSLIFSEDILIWCFLKNHYIPKVNVMWHFIIINKYSKSFSIYNK